MCLTVSKVVSGASCMRAAAILYPLLIGNISSAIKNCVSRESDILGLCGHALPELTVCTLSSSEGEKDGRIHELL